MSDKIKKEIFNGVGENVKALAQLFPSAVKDGEVDFAALKQELGEFVEVGAEKYDFTWAGKAKAKAEAVTDIPGRTLKYVQGDGVNEDTTGNLYIEGDNLEALKLLRNSYYNKIKMIYIDPPYNTGNDFVYKDNFAMTEEEKLAMAEAGEEVDEYGVRLVKNNGDNSKYHTNWLNMMYPRLKIARDVLTDDGVIFISIDDNEVENLKKICNEVFGEENFVGEIIRKTKSITNDANCGFNLQHENCFIYAKSCSNVNLSSGEKDFSVYKNLDNDPNGDWANGDPSAKSGGAGTYFEIVNPYTGKVDMPPMGRFWAFSKSTMDEYILRGKIKFKKVYSEKDRGFIFKKYKNDLKTSLATFNSLFASNNEYMNQIATKELIGLMGDSYFSYPKPVSFIKDIIKSLNDKDSLILDFFSGSATTAHAVMQLNAEDGGNRKYICVQVPELCDEKSEAFKAGYKNICEIGKERIRRAGKKIAEENKITVPNLDIGFKVFKVADTNIRMFSNELNNVELLGQVDIKDIDPEQIDFNNGATDLDVCYELLLRHRGIPLSSKVGKLPIGERTYIIADSIVVCLDKQVTESLVEQLAAIDPLPNKYIFRDSSFGDDISLKENTMIHLQAIIEKNSGASKKTYTVEFI